MVMRPPLKIRFLALFVLIFVCLNASGAVCVAYCRGFETKKAVTRHCPLQKAAAKHCNHTSQQKAPTHDSIVSVSDGFEFCPMTVTFLAATIETRSLVPAEPVLSAVVDPKRVVVSLVIDRDIAPDINYRGPPLLDRRTERIKHRILLI